MNALSEKSLIVLMALMLGLIIAWLITSDTNGNAPQTLAPIGSGTTAGHA